MGKIYTFINLVIPIIGSLVALQIFLLIFRREVRLKVNFFVFSVLAIATIRPNILGESFGLISPLYFATLVYFSRSLPPEHAPSDRAISRARHGLMMMLIILTLNWLFKASISSANGYAYSYWPPIASVLTVGISCFCVLQIFKMNLHAGESRSPFRPKLKNKVPESLASQDPFLLSSKLYIISLL
jgi:hypothetical protein